MISVYLDQDYAPFDVKWPDIHSVIDVGATTGCFTLWALKRAPDARVVAVEPNQNVFPFLLKNVEANGLVARVRTVPTALGAITGHAAVIDRTYSTLATVMPQSSATPSSVPMMTLRQLMAEFDIANCDLLKMDCEGAEYDILLTTGDDVLHRIGAIVCEFHPIPGRSVNELSEKLTAAGFRVSIFGAGLGFIVAKR
ncbi:MAG TPA: FkbM family methyltransferase [Candidatus Dormibacteraeota bacterium]|nr:FkbM family methyltransferase [Candidatus Dormibacteraeota bacterium]